MDLLKTIEPMTSAIAAGNRVMVKLAVGRIMFARLMNAGQTCIEPVLI